MIINDNDLVNLLILRYLNTLSVKSLFLAWIDKLPILSDKSFVADVNREVMSNAPWSIPGLKTLVQFAWAVTLNQLSTYIGEDIVVIFKYLINYGYNYYVNI